MNHTTLNSIFNIIYTPGTVQHLSFFVWSLLKWTSIHFRLVSNGCLPQEQRYLSELCATHDRLHYLAIPTKACLPHGQALNYLQALTQDEYFCFMDSDIFIVGNFIDSITPYLSEYAGVFSGMPLWVKAEEEVFPSDFQAITGMFNRSDSGLTLGSTFFSIYNNQQLNHVMQSTGIGFEEYRWEQLPDNIQLKIKDLGFSSKLFDTAKVINLLLLASNVKLVNLDLKTLIHIGGSSFEFLYSQNDKGLKRKLLDKLPGRELQAVAKQLLKARSYAVYKKNYAAAPDAEFQLNANQRILRRNPVRQYFLVLLNDLFQDNPLQADLITGDEETDKKVLTARGQLIAYFHEHNDKLVGH